MENLGGLDTTEEVTKEEEKVVDFQEKKRQPFCFWTVGEKTYQMKLKAGQIGKLENKYRRNIMNVVMDDGISPLSVMLTIIQAAMEPWAHGISYTDVQRLYDKWEEEGGNQTVLYAEVIIPLMAVSGFFTEKQSTEILEEMKNIL